MKKVTKTEELCDELTNTFKTNTTGVDSSLGTLLPWQCIHLQTANFLDDILSRTEGSYEQPSFQ